LGKVGREEYQVPIVVSIEYLQDPIRDIDIARFWIPLVGGKESNFQTDSVVDIPIVGDSGFISVLLGNFYYDTRCEHGICRVFVIIDLIEHLCKECTGNVLPFSDFFVCHVAVPSNRIKFKER